MKNYKTIILITLLIIILGSINSYSQNDNKKKFRTLVKQKLMEKLDISDSIADKYINLYNKNREDIKKLQQEKRTLMKDIEDNFDAADISDKIDRLVDIDLQIDKIKKEFINEAKTFLTPKQIAQSIIFQRNLKLFLAKEIKKKKKSQD